MTLVEIDKLVESRPSHTLGSLLPENFDTKRLSSYINDKSPVITVTGVDERTDLDKLRTLPVEVGFLYSRTKQGNRYPGWDWIRRNMPTVPAVSLHICGREAFKQLASCLILPFGAQRIQLNGTYTVDEVEMICGIYPNRQIITQHNEQNVKLLNVRCENHAVLVDNSGGKGILPEYWTAPDTAKKVGFAGGLNAGNLHEQLPLIRKVARPGWWVDMENGLRTNDWFDVGKAEECAKAVMEFLGTATDEKQLHEWMLSSGQSEDHSDIFDTVTEMLRDKAIARLDALKQAYSLNVLPERVQSAIDSYTEGFGMVERSQQFCEHVTLVTAVQSILQDYEPRWKTHPFSAWNQLRRGLAHLAGEDVPSTAKSFNPDTQAWEM